MQTIRTILKGIVSFVGGIVALFLIAFLAMLIKRLPAVGVCVILSAFGFFFFYLAFSGLRRDAVGFPKPVVTRGDKPYKFWIFVIGLFCAGIVAFAAGFYCVHHPEVLTIAKPK